MNPEATPSLFDERLARRLDGLLTLTGALLLLGIELVALGSGERVRGLFVIELFSLSLLAFAGFLRFARTPWLAVLAAALILLLCLRVSWFHRDIPTAAFPLALGLLTGLFLWRSGLPRAVSATLIPTALSLAVLMAYELGTFSAPLLWGFIAASARSRPLPEQPGPARWQGGHRWWRVLVAALVMILLTSAYHLLREPLELDTRPLFNAALLFGAVTNLVWCAAWLMLLRGVKELGSSTFWSAMRLGVGIQLVLVVLLMGAHVYGIAEELRRWPAYVAAGHSLTLAVLGRMLPLALLCVLLGTGRRHPGRLLWPWLVLGSEGLTLAYRTVIVAFELDRSDAMLIVIGGLVSVFELVAIGGLMRSLRDGWVDTSVADAFSEEPRVIGPGPG